MRNKLAALVIGTAVTVGLLVWVLQDVSFTEVLAASRRADWRYLGAAIVFATFSFVLRVPRWQILLRDDDGQPIASRPLWRGIAIGFMANNLIPLRAGELLRALAVNRLAKVRITAALSSLVAERLFDGLTIIAFLFIGLLTAGIPPGAEIAGFSVDRIATRLAIAPAVLLAACLAALLFPDLMKRIIRGTVPSERLAERLVIFLDGIRAGLAALTSPGRVAGAATWSVIHWLNNAFSFYLGFKAFGIPVSFGGALLMQSVLVVLIAAPSTPGYFGVFETAIKAVLVVFGIDSNVAVSYALTYHITTFAPITVLGLWALSRTPLRLSEIGSTTGRTPPPG